MAIITSVIIVISISGCVSDEPFEDYQVHNVSYHIEVKYLEIMELTSEILNYSFKQLGYEDVSVQTIFGSNNEILFLGTGNITLKDNRLVRMHFSHTYTNVYDLNNRTDFYGRSIDDISPIFIDEYGAYFYKYYFYISLPFEPPLDRLGGERYEEGRKIVKAEARRIISVLDLEIVSENHSFSSTGGS